MKKLMYFLIVFNVIIFSIVTYVDFSNQIGSEIMNNKVKMQIFKPYEVSNEVFLNDIEEVSASLKADLLMKTVKNASAIKPHYVFYRTSNQEDFIQLHTSAGETAFVEAGKRLSTEGEIYGSSLFYEVTFNDFSELNQVSLNANIYYVALEKANLLAKEIQEKGYDVELFKEEPTGFEELGVINLYQIFLLAFLFVSMLFYSFSRDKEIVIKKMHGYTSFNILSEELTQHVLFLLGLFTAVQTAVTVLTGIFFKGSAKYYFQYSIGRDLKILLVITILLLVSSLYIIIQKDISALKGNAKNKGIYILALISKTVASVAIILLLSYTQYHANLLKTSIQSLNETKKIADKCYTTTINISNTDIESNREECVEKATKFLDYLLKQYDPLICYTGIYDISDNAVLMVNSKYLDSISFCSMEGVKEFDTDKIFLILPEFIDEEYMKYNHLEEMILDLSPDANYETLRYSSDVKRFYTYNTDSTAGSAGYVISPVIICAPNECFKEFSISVLSGSKILFEESQNPYEKLLPVLKECQMDNLITETPKVTDLFEEFILETKIQLLRYGLQAVMYLFVLIVLIFFEIQMYFQVFKKITAIKFMNGYGIHSYQTAIYCQIGSAMIYFGLALFQGFGFGVTALVTLLNMTIFAVTIRKLFKNNIVKLMKGED